MYNPLSLLFIAAIRVYQKLISPYKGFRCAHAHVHQGPSCSGYAVEVIAENGVFSGWQLVRQRLRDCTEAYQVYLEGAEFEEAKRQTEKDRKNRSDHRAENAFDCSLYTCEGFEFVDSCSVKQHMPNLDGCAPTGAESCDFGGCDGIGDCPVGDCGS